MAAFKLCRRRLGGKFSSQGICSELWLEIRASDVLVRIKCGEHAGLYNVLLGGKGTFLDSDSLRIGSEEFVVSKLKPT